MWYAGPILIIQQLNKMFERCKMWVQADRAGLVVCLIYKQQNLS